MFSACFTQTITMYTQAAGSYVDGRYVDGTETSQDITASVQRLSMRERQLLEPGFRSSDTRKLYIPGDLDIQLIQNNQAQPQDAAEFGFEGKRFSMLASEKWEYLIDHWKITVVEKQ